MPEFAPSLAAAQARVAAVRPDDYARTRNALGGAVTRLSPYLTHGFLSLRQVHAAIHARQPLDSQHKLVFELGWRAYFHQVWGQLGSGIHQSLHAGLLPDDAYSRSLPADVAEARTGIPAIDMAVRELYATGYLHNHARMWLASYLVHMRKVHWHTGGAWMLGHLLDGDLASNFLSWQWVAGTGSSKPYLFNASNVAKFAPPAWHSPGSVLDTSYETLDEIARSGRAIVSKPDSQRAGVATPEPARPVQPLLAPQTASWAAPDKAIAAGRTVRLVHPWALNSGPSNQPADTLHIGIGIDSSHADFGWSEARWRFVSQGMQAQTPVLWWGNVQQIADALQSADTISWQWNLHANPALEQLRKELKSRGQTAIKTQQPRELFEPVSKRCKSFTEWWRQTRVVEA